MLLPIFSFSKSIEDYKLAVDTLFFSDKSKALELSNIGLKNAFEINDTFYITYFLDQAGELNRMAGNYDLAISQLDLCLKYKVNWEDLKDLSLTYNNLGKTFAQKGYYDQAVFNFIEALKLMEQDKNLIGQAFYLNNIGVIYDLQHNYFKALDYYKQSLNIKYELKDSNGIAASCTNVGITYFNLNKFNEAIDYHQKAYDIYDANNLITKKARTLINIGKAYTQLQEFEKAKYYLNQAANVEDQIEDELLVMTLNNNMATLFIELNRPDSAHYYNQKSYELAKASNSLQGLFNSSKIESKIFEIEGNFEQALIQERLGFAYNDSLRNQDNIYAVAEMESKYNLEKKEKELQKKSFEIQKAKLLQEKEANQKKVYILLFAVSVLLIGFLVFSGLKNKQINRLLKAQNELIISKNNALENIKNALTVELKDKTEVLENIFSKNQTENLPPELLSLSKREMEVLAQLALGLTDQQIADKLFISKSTAKTHLRRIYSKLLVNGRAGAVSIAHKYEILGDVN